MIQLLKTPDVRKPYPLSEFAQRLLFRELPPHMERMALFKINTGTREQEVCRFRWEWEVEIPEMKTSVFILPDEFVKNGEERLVKMYNSAWLRARQRAADWFEKETGKSCPLGFRNICVHDLKHAFGRRLRAAGVSFEDRQDLSGHKSGRITTHYSAAELENLIEAANKVCQKKSRKTPALVMLRGGAA